MTPPAPQQRSGVDLFAFDELVRNLLDARHEAAFTDAPPEFIAWRDGLHQEIVRGRTGAPAREIIRLAAAKEKFRAPVPVLDDALIYARLLNVLEPDSGYDSAQIEQTIEGARRKALEYERTIHRRTIRSHLGSESGERLRATLFGDAGDRKYNRSYQRYMGNYRLEQASSQLVGARTATANVLATILAYSLDINETVMRPQRGRPTDLMLDLMRCVNDLVAARAQLHLTPQRGLSKPLRDLVNRSAERRY